MRRHQGLRWLLTLVVVLSVGYLGWRIFHADQYFRFPFARIANAHTAIVRAENDVALPAPLKPDDRIELSALAPGARIALIKSANLNWLPGGAAYGLVVQHADTRDAPVAMTLHSVHFANKYAFQALSGWGLFSFLSYPFCLAIIALLTCGRVIAGTQWGWHCGPSLSCSALRCSLSHPMARSVWPYC